MEPMPSPAVVLRDVASRFSEGGCCGRTSKVSYDDIDALGLLPIPQTFASSLGTIMPLFGWKEMCVWVHEALAGPFPAAVRPAPGEDAPDPGLAVAEALRRLADEVERAPAPVASVPSGR